MHKYSNAITKLWCAVMSTAWPYMFTQSWLTPHLTLVSCSRLAPAWRSISATRSWPSWQAECNAVNLSCERRFNNVNDCLVSLLVIIDIQIPLLVFPAMIALETISQNRYSSPSVLFDGGRQTLQKDMVGRTWIWGGTCIITISHCIDSLSASPHPPSCD